MPLKLNVGASKKVGEPNYGSRGASINLELEVDASMAADSNRLMDTIRRMYGTIRASLNEELNGHHAPAEPNGRNGNGSCPATTNGIGGHAPNGRNGDDENRKPKADGHDDDSDRPRPATPKQIKCLLTIARGRVKLAEIIRNRYQVGRPEALDIQQASELIDEIRQETANGTH